MGNGEFKTRAVLLPSVIIGIISGVFLIFLSNLELSEFRVYAYFMLAILAMTTALKISYRSGQNPTYFARLVSGASTFYAMALSYFIYETAIGYYLERISAQQNFTLASSIIVIGLVLSSITALIVKK